jgi:hypothetical protein
MGKDTQSVLGGPAIVLLGIGALLSAALFYFMFRYADEGNLLMVIITSLLIVVTSTVVIKCLTSISRNKFSK